MNKKFLLTGVALTTLLLASCGEEDTKASNDYNSTPEEAKAKSEELEKEYAEAEKISPKFENDILKNSELQIKITNHKVIKPGEKGNEYGEKPVIAFWYDITNISGADVTPMNWISLIQAFQDNNPDSINELNVGSLPDDQFLDSQSEKIKIGGTVKSAVSYELDDETTPVELVYSDVVSDKEYGRISYNLK
ncbi:DUF5067 domain-containing protein [Listeria cornellensis]|uniref:DUF5067 domain-containing protein n=1 Tax=Listeria cornellensis FSL F6-0969 TaxID=1265820 RepID=W7BN96_9LIST|nr:DUF5067 domain-containing protein [Listeria cornellensis]EUJ27367.1 hypothetical protein PCORN_13597 [Listeria cornellensis FSL F6-0969]